MAASVGVVDASIEGLVCPLPEHHRVRMTVSYQTYVYTDIDSHDQYTWNRKYIIFVLVHSIVEQGFEQLGHFSVLTADVQSILFTGEV